MSVRLSKKLGLTIHLVTHSFGRAFSGRRSIYPQAALSLYDFWLSDHTRNYVSTLSIFALFRASICVKLGYHARRARPGETGLVDLVFPVYFITFCLPPHSLSPSTTIDSIPSNLQCEQNQISGQNPFFHLLSI